ncbi:hypothetical protein NQ317_015318 [Molorchus minor]|uniref:Uncharacterized protein n=1 Tax=Molorchus minor TaxID=1323400 RepID=A0ABQ9JBT6_9CUCU|nr:hypothetical protein NQ317_015318 [Molorchus minor]
MRFRCINGERVLRYNPRVKSIPQKCVDGDASTQELGLLPVTNEATETTITAEIQPASTEDSETIIIDVAQNPTEVFSEMKKRKRQLSSTTSSMKTIQEMHEETLDELKSY